MLKQRVRLIPISAKAASALPKNLQDMGTFTEMDWDVLSESYLGPPFQTPTIGQKIRLFGDQGINEFMITEIKSAFVENGVEITSIYVDLSD